MVLLGFIGWLVIQVTPEQDVKGKASHFTIPVLSPFTSVVRFFVLLFRRGIVISIWGYIG